MMKSSHALRNEFSVLKIKYAVLLQLNEITVVLRYLLILVNEM